MQRALLQYYEPRNAQRVIKALQLVHRADLIPLLVPGAARARVQKKEIEVRLPQPARAKGRGAGRAREEGTWRREDGRRAGAKHRKGRH